MKYLVFKEAFQNFPVFSVKDIQKRFPDFDNRRLVEWQEKGYLLKVRRGYYCFTEQRKDEKFSYFLANAMYSPSYLSLESGLAFYNLIPEGVFITTSVTTRNTANHNTSIGIFDYRHINKRLFFGYRLLKEQSFTFKIAEPEKVVLDFFYLNKIDSPEEMEELRLNEIQAKEIINFEKLDKYQRVFDSRVINKRMQLFKNMINA
ncbi:type IV toxin-antitoxin system AbiEi family antitoxin domain-containing protein [Echinicola rosea]|uniref:Transcriptional regulator, AbiEi antitoxin, Type IV TA system n=1 Tax=Echinicola rosea TaxID=1807691 RepID=A0ABQ1VB78_9BACT|nr:hypothetical protein [Echinicola rosea]GGF49585.1 hypothetical protein GCM10011339_42730 [Echinicola rosea]